MELKDKIVVITGGSRGIGKSLAKSFIAEGAEVVISSQDQEQLQTTAKELNVDGILCDVREEKQVQDLAKQVSEKYGRIDIWVNNAGVFHSFSKSDEFVPMDRAREMIDVNFFGLLFGSRVALRKIEKGAIVNIISTAGLDATRAKNSKIYAASKWAARGYTDAIRGQNENSHLQILSVYPGGTQTELFDYTPEQYDQFLNPDDLAGKIVANLKLDEPEIELVVKRPKQP